MNLQRLNDFFVKGMIGVFASILPFSLLTLAFPILGYLVAFLLIVLMIVTGVAFVLSSILLVKQMVSILDSLQKQYEQQQQSV
jgi:ABC-type transport system involved in cytochrome bd biosynthesis fused ATPase/permease subunit